MKRDILIKKMKARAKRMEELRKDPRYRRVLEFFVHLGLLQTNQRMLPARNGRIPLSDAIWAGKNIEPRILEVLPAAFARLPQRFTFTAAEAADLEQVIECLHQGKPAGPDFMTVPYEKLKVWYNLPLRDRRTKTPKTKKLMRTFRLLPNVIAQLEKRARAEKMNATEFIEKLILESVT